MITAIVFVQADVARIPEVAEAIAALDGVCEVYSVTGQVDLIVMVRVRRHEEVAAVVADRLNKVPGVTSTETHIAFRAYSRHDLESAFASASTDDPGADREIGSNSVKNHAHPSLYRYWRGHCLSREDPPCPSTAPPCARWRRRPPSPR